MKNAFLLAIMLLISSHAFATVSMTSLEGKNVLDGKIEKIDFTTSRKGAVLVFMSSKCPCSASHEDILKKLADEYKGFVFVGIHSNADENATDTKAHFQTAHLNFPVLQDQKNTWANQLGALKTPHTFVFNNKGELLYQGGVTDSHVGPAAKHQFLKEVLSDIQGGKEPRMKEGRALGCFIQRED